MPMIRCPHCGRLNDDSHTVCGCGRLLATTGRDAAPSWRSRFGAWWEVAPTWKRVLLMIGVFMVLSSVLRAANPTEYRSHRFSPTHWACQRCGGTGKVLVTSFGEGIAEAECPRCGGTGVDPESPDNGPSWHFLQ